MTFILARRLALLAPCLALAAPAQAATTQLAAHRAVYELSLLKSSGTNAPTQARGRIAFDFTGSSCDGYVQNFRQITELQPSEGQARMTDMRSATFEGGDGKDYRFKVTTSVGPGRSEDVDGRAKKAGAEVAIDLAKPKHTHVALAGPALFPTEHVRHILAAAQAGEHILETKVYDGSGDGEKVFDTLAVIGKQRATPATEKAVQIDALKGLRRWPVAISYFEPNKRDGQPVYILSFDLYENGVSRALNLDYGDFSLKGEMTELTMLPASTCAK